MGEHAAPRSRTTPRTPRTPRTPKTPHARRALIAAALAIAALAGITGTYAYWTDHVEVSGVDLQAGTIDLKVNGADTLTTFTAMNITNMVPGNSVAGVLTVSNAGTFPLTYYVDASATSDLGAALVATVTGAASVTGSAPAATCGGATLSPSGTTFATSLVGSSGSPRTLAVGASETLCFQATLPLDADSSLQGMTSALTFTFHASQVLP